MKRATQKLPKTSLQQQLVRLPDEKGKVRVSRASIADGELVYGGSWVFGVPLSSQVCRLAARLRRRRLVCMVGSSEGLKHCILHDVTIWASGMCLDRT